ncbi:MAG: alpha-amylase family glycosyl hydrolase [Pseudomonadota bacterium]
MLHVPSPDWRDQVIYFLMLDRFDDGDPGNNDQGQGEYDPRDGARYSGGDLAGVKRRLDYIQGLGATAVWLTPIVANQWWDGSRQFGGYHGYWAENFKAVDAHNGNLADYQRLSDALHRRGMYLVQDVVVNHTGNFFDYKGPWSADDPSRNLQLNPASVPVARPSQSPFDQNDARNPQHRAAAIYHWTPEIRDHHSLEQEQTFQLAGLDDLNTRNPVVRAALRDSYSYWIRTAGVDAFRIDTAFHVEPDFFADFLYHRDAANPGVVETARQTGRQQFHVFGEGFGVAPAYDDNQAMKVDRWMRRADGTPLLPGMINFPLYGSIVDVFARGKPSAELGHRLASSMRLHANPHLMPTFVDNHDVDRFLASGNEAGLKQALLFIMTVPGIPTLYYGTEQGFRAQRQAMFAGGHGAGGTDHFDRNSALYRYIASVTALRREHRLFSRGTPTVLSGNSATAGALAYRMDADSGSALVIFNSANRETLLDNLDTGLPAGTVLEPLYSIEGKIGQLTVGHNGLLHLRLPAHAGQVWRVGAAGKAPPAPATSVTLAALPSTKITSDISVGGSANGSSHVRLVLDGDWHSSQRVAVDSNGNWQTVLRTDSLINPATAHRLVAATDAETEARFAISAAQTFVVERSWQTRLSEQDPANDDRGANGRYRYPTDHSWQGIRPLDLRRIDVASSGGSLELRVTLADLVASWNPPNGFDHLALTVFLQMPGQDGGSRLMPLQQSQLPDDMRWHYRLRINGWSNTLFQHSGSDERQEGTAIGSADLQVDRERKQLRLRLPAQLLGNPRSLSGVRLFINSWDYDSGYKTLSQSNSNHSFSGGVATDPLYMDTSRILQIP